MSKGFKKTVQNLSANKTIPVAVTAEDAVMIDRMKVHKGQVTTAVKSEPKEESVPQSTFTQEEAAAIARTAAEQAAAKAVEEALKDVPAQIEAAKAEAQKEIDEIKSEADKAIAEAENTAKEGIALVQREKESEIAAIEEQKNEAIAQKQTELESAQQDKKALEGVMKLSGIATPVSPGINTKTNPLKTEPKGLASELVGLIQNEDALKKKYIQDPRSGMYAFQKETGHIKRFIANHFAECRSKKINLASSPLIKDVEQYFKNHGLLSGSVPVPGTSMTSAAGPTIGTPGVAGDVFLDILSNLIRETHNQSNIFWQFCMTVFDATTVPSQNMQVPRWSYIPEPEDIADFELATTTTYTPVAGAIGTNADSQSLEVSTVPISVTQYGMGKSNKIGNRPVFIPEFHQSITLLSLMDALDSRIMQNYFKFEELLIRLQYESTTVTLFNKGGAIEVTPANIAAGDGATMTEAFANAVYAEMYAQQIPTYPGGCYVLVLNPYAADQFKASLGDRYRPVSEEQNMAITNIFRMAHGVDIGRVNQYFGDYCGFHVFIGNSFGVVAGTPTVNTETFGSGATLTGDSFAFGPGCVGRGVSLAAEIRASGVNPFQLGESYIWLSREGVAPMDLDVALDPNQQTRCYKLRTAKTPV